MKHTPTSKPSDARLKALLRGLREDVAAPPDFGARVLRTLRREGLLARAEPEQASGSWWAGLGAGLSAPRWGLALAASLALGLVLWLRPVAPPLASSSPAMAARAPMAAAPAPSPARPSGGEPRDLAAPSAPAPSAAGPVHGSMAAAASLPRASSAPRVIAEEAPVVVASVPAVQAASPARLQVSSPSLGLGAAGGQGAAGSGASMAPAGFASGGGSTSGPAQGFGADGASGAAGGLGGGASGRAGALALGSKAPTATPSPTATPAASVNTQPTLAPNSQVRNNVILASRGQSAQILFKVARSGQVLVAIYSRLGQKVAVLQDGTLAEGQYDLAWSGQADFGGLAASGIYEVVIQTPTYTDLHKMMLVK